MGRILRRTARVLAWVLGSFVLLFVTAWVLLQLTWVQNRLLPIANNLVSGALKTKVTIGHVDISFPDKVVLVQLSIQDQHGQPLLHAKEARIGFLYVPILDFINKAPGVRLITARTVSLNEATLNLYKTKRDGTFNAAFIFDSGPPKKGDTSAPTLLDLRLPNVQITRLNLSYRDSTQNDTEFAIHKHRVNMGHLAVDSAGLETSLTFLHDGKLALGLLQLKLVERNSGCRISELDGSFETNLKGKIRLPDRVAPKTANTKDLAKKRGWKDLFKKKPPKQTGPLVPADTAYVRLKHAHLVMDATRLDLDADLENETLASLLKEDGPKTYRFDIRPSLLDFNSLNYFVKDPLPLRGVMGAEGRIIGGPTRLRSRNLVLKYGDGTQINAIASITNYKADERFIELQLDHSTVVYNDLVRLLPGVALPRELSRMGRMNIVGRFTGYVDDFVADADFNGLWGRIITNIQLKTQLAAKVPGRRRPPPVVSYSGELRTEKLNLDQILGSAVSNNLNFRGNIKGQGFTLATINSTFDFQILSSNILHYAIDSIGGALTLRYNTIAGDLKIQDREGGFDGKINIDMTRPKPSYKMVGNLDRLNLKAYHLVKDSITASTIFNVNLAGDSLDNISGIVRLFQIDLFNNRTGQHDNIHDIELKTEQNTTTAKNYRISSRLLDMNLAGNFSYAKAIRLMERLSYESELYFRNDSNQLKQYYSSKAPDLEPLNLDYQLVIKDMNPTLRFLNTGISFARGSRLKGAFHFDREIDQMTLAYNTTLMRFDSLSAQKVTLKMSLEKDAHHNLLSANATLHADTLTSSSLVFDNVNFTPRVRNNVVTLRLGLSQDHERRGITANAEAELLAGQIRLRLNPDSTHILLNDDVWSVNPYNILVYAPGVLKIENLQLSNGQQSLAVEADIDNEKSDFFRVSVRDVQLAELSELTTPRIFLKGVANIELNIRQLFTKPQLKVNGSILGFAYNDLPYGDLYTYSNWSGASQRLFLRVNMVQRADTLLALEGYYNPRDEKNSLDFLLTTHNLPLNLASPFLKGIVYDVRGSVVINNLSVQGTLAMPEVRGTGYLNKVSLGIEYFKTRYAFEGQINFNPRNIHFPDIVLKDVRGHQAKLAGYINHTGFRDFNLDLHLFQIDNFQVMDTKTQDNDLYFGKFVVQRGACDITGPWSRVNVDARVTTGAGTQQNIPISFYRQGKRLPFVYFTQNGQNIMRQKAQVGVLGLNLKLEVNATPDAELRMIFNEKTGEVISGKGNGLITMNITPEGEFSMFGQFEVETGNYLFKLKNIVSKPFEVDQGGTITWAGDPLGAQLDLSAIYRVYASLAALDTTQSGNRAVDVLLKLKGSLFSPEITFDLNLPNTDAGSSSLAVNARIRAIQSDPQELNRQVFSLIAFQKFAPEGSFFGGAGGGATASLTEFLSGQINNLLGKQLGDKFNLSVTSTAFQDVSLNLKAKLFNERLTIERNGTLISQYNQDVSLGNVTIQYRLLPGNLQLNRRLSPGTLSAEVFSRDNFGYSTTVTSTDRGGGILYRKEFDSFSQLFRRRRKAPPLLQPLDTNRRDSLLTIPAGVLSDSLFLKSAKPFGN